MFFFFNDTATTEIYTLSLHDALPISAPRGSAASGASTIAVPATERSTRLGGGTRTAVSVPVASSKDRKSTCLNSSHANISYAVFCLKKKKNNNIHLRLLLTLLFCVSP